MWTMTGSGPSDSTLTTWKGLPECRKFLNDAGYAFTEDSASCSRASPMTHSDWEVWGPRAKRCALGCDPMRLPLLLPGRRR